MLQPASFSHEVPFWVSAGIAGIIIVTLSLVKAVLRLARTDIAQAVYDRIKRMFLPASLATSIDSETSQRALQALAASIGRDLDDDQTYLGLKRETPLGISFRGAWTSASPPQRLVVLGIGGSGKSILLQSLSLKILERRYDNATLPLGRHKNLITFNLDTGIATSILDDWLRAGEDNSFIPVPVIFNLSTWDEGTRIDDWMTDQLLRLRYVPALGDAMARHLIDNRLILPMLDGFDEVGEDMRAPLMEQLNIDKDRPLVLTSRPGSRLPLSNAATIELDRIPQAEAEARLPGIPEDIIKKAIRTPLMIDIARAVYRDGGTTEFTEMRIASAEEMERRVLKEFVPAIYGRGQGLPTNRMERRNRPPCGVNTTLSTLRYLAGQSEQIAWWEIGTSGMTHVKRSLITALVCGTAAAIGHAVAAFTGVALHLQSPANAGLLTVAYAIMTAFITGLIYWIMAKHRSHLLEPSELSIILIRRSGRPRRKLSGNEAKQLRFWYAFPIGSIIGFTAILVFTALSSAVASLRLGATVAFYSPHALTAELAFMVAIALVMGFTSGLGTLIMEPLEIREGAGPLALLAASRRTAIRGATIAVIICGVEIGIVSRIFDSTDPTIVIAGVGAVGGGTIGIGGILSVTAWGQWVIFCRLWLPLTGRLPWRVHAFLQDAQRRGVLRQAGGYYQFRHSRLRDAVAERARAGQSIRSSSPA